MGNKNKAVDRMWELVERDHGGCDEESCALAHAIESGEVYDAIYLWACSGAADEEFEKLYTKHEKFISRMYLERT